MLLLPLQNKIERNCTESFIGTVLNEVIPLCFITQLTVNSSQNTTYNMKRALQQHVSTQMSHRQA
jgi:hypothetical protein